jgi:hypothetical protein
LLLATVDHTLPTSMNECGHIKAEFAGGRSTHNATGVATAGHAVKRSLALPCVALQIWLDADSMRVGG